MTEQKVTEGTSWLLSKYEKNHKLVDRYSQSFERISVSWKVSPPLRTMTEVLSDGTGDRKVGRLDTRESWDWTQVGIWRVKAE